MLGVGKHEGSVTLAPRFLQNIGGWEKLVSSIALEAYVFRGNLECRHKEIQACLSPQAVLSHGRPHLLLARVPGRRRHIGALVLGDVVAGAPTT